MAGDGAGVGTGSLKAGCVVLGSPTTVAVPTTLVGSASIGWLYARCLKTKIVWDFCPQIYSSCLLLYIHL